MGLQMVQTGLAEQVVDKSSEITPTSAPKRNSQGPVLASGRMQETILCTANQHLFGSLYPDLLKARKSVFIDQKLWDLPNCGGMEFDQYDTPLSRSVVIHEYGRILGGVRLLPTTAQCGCYSYMLRDAQRGLLPNIPEYILYDTAPVKTNVWEATRLFVSQNEPAERRAILQTKLITAMAQAARDQGATHVIGIVPAVFRRWMNRLGLDAVPLGPKLHIDEDSTQAAVMYVGG